MRTMGDVLARGHVEKDDNQKFTDAFFTGWTI